MKKKYNCYFGVAEDNHQILFAEDFKALQQIITNAFGMSGSWREQDSGGCPKRSNRFIITDNDTKTINYVLIMEKLL